MKPEHKKYILENINKKSIKELALDLGLKERKVRKFVEVEKQKKKLADFKEEAKTTVQPARKVTLLASLALIAILGLIAYRNSFHSVFHFDDYSFLNEKFALSNIQDLRYIWNFWPTRFITYLSIAFNYQCGGLEVFGYHVFNFVLHLGSAVFVWWLAILTLNTAPIKEKKIAAYVQPLAFFASAIFLLHPLQTQSVNYISQRATIMAAFFYLASLSLYAKARLKQEETPGSRIRTVYYIGSLLAAALSMFSKEMAISLPLAVCLYEFCFFRSKKPFSRKYLVPFLALLLVIPFTMLATKSVDFLGMRRVTQDYPRISAGHYFLTQFKVMVTYLRLLLIPLNQNLDYDYPIAKSIFEISVIFSSLLLFLILLAATRLFHKYRLISFTIFWFFITLFPESSVIPIDDVIFEHRLYLPLFSYSLFLAGWLYYLFNKKSAKFIVILLSLLVACYSILTYQRNKVWENEFTLWNDTVAKSPRKSRPYNNRGTAYQKKGNLDQAISDYSKAIEIKPDYPEPYNNRGAAYQKKGNFDQAISDCNKAIELNPEYADAYNNRGSAYQDKGNFDQAIASYNKAIEIKPDFHEPYYNRGNAYNDKGEFDKAIHDFNKSIEAFPYDAEVYTNRGVAYANKGKFDQAILNYNKAIEINPKIANAYNNRGNAYSHKGKFDRAITDFNKSIEINPYQAMVYNNRGLAYGMKGNPDQAIADYNKAIELKADYPAAYYNRALAYFRKQEYTESWEDVHKAEILGYKVQPEFIEELRRASRKQE